MFFLSFRLENLSGQMDAGGGGGSCLCGLKAAGLRRKGKAVIVTCLCRACYDRREIRMISYVETRRLRRNRVAFTP